MRLWSGFRARGARPIANFLQHGAGGIAGDHGYGDDTTAGGFHFLTAHDLIARPIATFYEDVGEQARDEFARRQVIENHDSVHTFERSKNFGTLAFGDDGAAHALQLPHTGITVQPDDESVSQFARQLQAADVTGMEQVKATVGENDALSAHTDRGVAFLAAKPQNRLLKREDCRVQQISMEARKNQMTPIKKIVYHAQEARRPRARSQR
jgi:hypothetical protein